MEVISITDQEDGSAIVELSMTEAENNMLIEYAVVDILRKQMEKLSRVCCDCQEPIDDETIKKYPDTEICGDCLEP
jgi:RNA polymerase-binding transcription factor DksA